VLMPEMGSVGPWTAVAALIIVAAGFFQWRWRGDAWKKIDLFGDGEAPAGKLAGKGC